MKITALAENRSDRGLKTVHGLSLYIETEKHKLLFDVGPDYTLFENGASLGIDLSETDVVILSHGHRDHGGELGRFLEINHGAIVYAQRKAFENHSSKMFFKKADIGVDARLQTHPRVILSDGDYEIDDELKLFTVPETGKYRSDANKSLYTDTGKDDFSHEQNLMITGETNVLIMGCGHAGIVNILDKAAAYKPRFCVGGWHLQNPVTKKTVNKKLLSGIAGELAKHEINFYTCHCTGTKAYDYFSGRLPDIHYLSCGETIII
ncbi:MAG: MBL fold metallo-hydrolase [Oscillospiraceae bacterium]|nr:MBL fold metallo-hydrolase [Oscillospiraceae bacterium]